jgi:outer membrane protein
MKRFGVKKTVATAFTSHRFAKHSIELLAALLFLLVAIPGVATAQDSWDDKNWAKSFFLRARAVGVFPENSAGYNLPIQTDVSDSFIPEIDLTYFLTDNFAVETICCATPHTISLAGGPDIGEAWLVPLMVTGQYHFHLGKGVKPYIGAGPTLAIVASDSAKGPATSFDLETVNPGVVLQAGIDVKLKNNWYLNADIKKLFVDISANATAGGNVFGKASIDPLIVGFGIGYKF